MTKQKVKELYMWMFRKKIERHARTHTSINRCMKKRKKGRKIRFPLNLSFPFVVAVVGLVYYEYSFEYFQVSFLHVDQY